MSLLAFELRVFTFIDSHNRTQAIWGLNLVAMRYFTPFFVFNIHCLLICLLPDFIQTPVNFREKSDEIQH